ncbi:sulfotransferase [Roseovarius sp. PS-C2]|nr:sulfotransferase [Roseovarius sp. PS-C2]
MPRALQNIALHGAPRSGTTWLAEIFNSVLNVKYCHQPLFSYAFKGFLSDCSGQTEVACFFRALSKTQDRYVMQVEEREQGIVPDFSKTAPTHLIYKEVRYHHILPNLLDQNTEVKAVLLVRDPRAVVSSFLEAPREFRSDLGWKIEEEWRTAPKKNQNRPEEFFGFEKWKEAANIFNTVKEQHPSRVMLVHYADLLRSTEDTVRELFKFCGLKFDTQTRDFLAGRIEGNSKGDYTVFRKRVAADDKWRTSLPAVISDEICADIDNTPLSRFLD